MKTSLAALLLSWALGLPLLAAPAAADPAMDRTQWFREARFGLLVKVGDVSRSVDLPATGKGLEWKSIPLGSIELPAGEAVIELKPDPQQWQPIQLRKVTRRRVK